MTSETTSQQYLLKVFHKNDEQKQNPIAWLLLEKKENYQRYESNGPIQQASITLAYRRIVPHLHREDRGQFEGGFKQTLDDDHAVSITSAHMGPGAVFLDLPGLESQRIGTYLISQIVAWVQQWPEATVDPVNLLEGQAQTEEEKTHRNEFYRQFGLEFDFEDPDKKAGQSKPIQAKDLKTVTKWSENIEEVSLYDFAANLLSSEEGLRQSVNRLVKERKWADAHPVRCFWWRLRATLGV